MDCSHDIMKILLPVTCPHLSLTYGEIDYDGRGKPAAPDGNWPIGTEAFFQCNTGYALHVGNTRFCQNSCKHLKIYNAYLYLMINLFEMTTELIGTGECSSPKPGDSCHNL